MIDPAVTYKLILGLMCSPRISFGIMMVMGEISRDLKNYVEGQIFPRYTRFYSHGLEHIKHVLATAMMLAEAYNLNPEMMYVIVAYHDLGLKQNRAEHEREPGKILASDAEIKCYFGPEKVKIMREAIEDHRGSRKERPRSIYGECVSDADRDFEVTVLAKRQLATSWRNYPELSTFDEHFERCYEYMCRRINRGGVFNLWTNYPALVMARDRFQAEFLDKARTRAIYCQEWERMLREGVMEKLENYYEDY